ncbi:type VI secretion system Vgr family protein [soil metagenome]
MLAAAAHIAPFGLTLEHIPNEAFGVRRWRIEARLDAPYEVTVVIHVQRAFAALFGRRPPHPVCGQRASFLLQSQASTFEPFHGRIAMSAYGRDELDADHPWGAGAGGEVVSCTLTIRPRLWWASLAQRSRSFQRMTAEDVVHEVLAPHGLRAQDIEFRSSAPLAPRRYRQQYEETDLAFVSRTLERAGLAWFFEQRADREVLVVTDSAAGFVRPPQWSGVRRVAAAGRATPRDDDGAPGASGWNQVITSFALDRRTVTADHAVDDHNYRAAGQGLRAEHPGTGTPLGHHNSYGTHAKTPDGAATHVRHQAEREAQHARRGVATSTLTALAPGHCIGIVEAYAGHAGHGGDTGDSAGRWLVLAVQSWGDRQTPYANRFELQPEQVPYRPEWRTPLPAMPGFTHMRLDTTNAANPYARLDAHGRYLAWHHFEYASSPGHGMGSAPLRLARDYAGPSYGQHFPVHADVEALAGYVHGDPDRPVLMGVVHDSRHPNHVTSANASRHVLRTWANNKLRMEDEAGREHLKLATEHGLSQLNLGHMVNQDRQERGQGFELRTDHEGALRAQQGWLLSTAGTDVRGDPKGEGHQLHLQPLGDYIEGIRPWAENRSLAATQVGLEAASSLKAADAFAQNLPGVKTPLQASFSPEGIVFGARKNLVFGAEQTQGFYAQGPITLASAAPFGLTAKKGLRLHAESGGLRKVVSNGDYTVHVQQGDWTVLAKEAVKFESKTGVVRVQTKGGQYFVEVGPEGFRTNAKEIHHKAGVQVDFTGGPVTGAAGANAGSAQGLDYFGRMEVKDVCVECLLKARLMAAPFSINQP